MSKVERAREYRSAYSVHRDLPIWDLIALENQGILKWRFRPRYIDRRVKKAIRRLQEEPQF